jgi:hypothetical protein
MPCPSRSEARGERATAGILAWRSRFGGSAIQLRDSAGLAPDFPRLVALCGCADQYKGSDADRLTSAVGD